MISYVLLSICMLHHVEIEAMILCEAPKMLTLINSSPMLPCQIELSYKLTLYCTNNIYYPWRKQHVLTIRQDHYKITNNI